MLPSPHEEEVRLLHHVPEVGIDHGEFDIPAQHVGSREIPTTPGFRLILYGGRFQEYVQPCSIRRRPCRRHYGGNPALPQIRDRPGIPLVSPGLFGFFCGASRFARPLVGHCRRQRSRRQERRTPVPHHRLELEIRPATLPELRTHLIKQLGIRNQLYSRQMQHLGGS